MERDSGNYVAAFFFALAHYCTEVASYFIDWGARALARAIESVEEYGPPADPEPIPATTLTPVEQSRRLRKELVALSPVVPHTDPQAIWDATAVVRRQNAEDARRYSRR